MNTQTTQADRLMQARCRLLAKEPWYGHMCMNIQWIQSEMSWLPTEQRTMGVRMVNGGDIQCLYFPPFVASQSVEQLFAIVQHEIEHLVRVHCLRSGDRHHVAWNIACDMTVNGPQDQPRIGYHDTASGTLVLPFDGNIVWIPDNWTPDGSAESYYDRLMKESIKLGDEAEDGEACPGCGQDQAQEGVRGEGQESNHCPVCGERIDPDTQPAGQLGRKHALGQSVDNHTVWTQSNVSEDEARQVIKDAVDQASEKTQGNIPGHLAEVIDQLGKPTVRWREILRHHMGRYVGNRRYTYSRRNRRRSQFGVPGISHRAAASVCVIVDTSMSISSRELKQFFSEIDMIATHARVHVLLWDVEFQGYSSYRRGDWKKIPVNGRGGTDMAAPIRWLIDNKLVTHLQIMLTDGITNWINPDCVNFPFVTVICNDPLIAGPGYGYCVHMNGGC